MVTLSRVTRLMGRVGRGHTVTGHSTDGPLVTKMSHQLFSLRDVAIISEIGDSLCDVYP